MTLSSAWMIKGWLIAKDAPMEVLHAANDVIRSMKDIALLAARETDAGDGKDEQPLPEVVEIPVTKIGLSRPVQRSETNLPTDGKDRMAEPSPIVPAAPEQPILAAEKPKQKRNWSPEARAAAAERMRALRAKKTQAPDPGEAPAPSAMSGGAI
jgi:hypothetical protein